MSREIGQVRRFGAVNWLGLKTLAWRETRSGLKDYNYQILGPVVSSLLYLAVFHLTISTVGAAGADAGAARYHRSRPDHLRRL